MQLRQEHKLRDAIPRGMPLCIMMISKAAQTEVVTQLDTLSMKVCHMEGKVKIWIDRKCEEYSRMARCF